MFFYIFRKPVMGHLCFKYLKMIISTNYALYMLLNIFYFSIITMIDVDPGFNMICLNDMDKIYFC